MDCFKSVDVLREREQRARLQLLDEIREPQPIFGEPVKVDLQDETSRRIKNTLGDFTQVLINDPKNLIGISRSTPTNPSVGGVNKRLSTGHASAPLGFPRSQAGLKKTSSSNGANVGKPSLPVHMGSKGSDKQLCNTKILQSSISSPIATKTSHSAVQLPNLANETSLKDSASKDQRNSIPVINLEANIGNISGKSTSMWNSGTPNVPTFPFHPSTTPSKELVQTSSSNNPAKKNNGRPLNSRTQLERNLSNDAPPIAVETILKQMTDVVPSAPLTGIQTPRKEEIKQDDLSLKDCFPSYQYTDVDFPSLKISSPKVQWNDPDPLLPKNINLESILFESTAKDTEKTVSLQDDLAVSDSDEEVVPELKTNPELYLKSPVEDCNLIVNSNTMDNNSAESSNSSSSEESDSDDSSSESNDSDSSSEVSDEEISSKKWGLSNFVDESQRIHSPAFFPADAPKESIQPNVESIKSPDLNTINHEIDACLAQKMPPVMEAASFLIPDVPVAAKSDILSPILSPIHTQVGPRTPPSPSYSLKQDSLETIKNNAEALDSQIESKSYVESLSNPLKSDLQTENPLDHCDKSAEKGNVQNERCQKKQLRSSKVKELNSVTDSSKATLAEGKDIVTDSEKSVTSNVASTSKSSENYPIKTRQSLSAARRKSIQDNSQTQKQEEDNSAIAKLKHPRACRKFAEKQSKKNAPNKLKSSDEPKKVNKQELKETSGISDKPKAIQKSVTNINTVPKTQSIKNTARFKGKGSKTQLKKSLRDKKPEIKKKKFAIKNFVQSPEKESIKPLNVLSPFTPSPERSPIPEIQIHHETPAEPSAVSSVLSKPQGKSNINNPVKAKKVEKLRRSVRCSERASNSAQADSSPQQTSSKVKKSSKIVEKAKHTSENKPISIEPPAELLSPIQYGPSMYECGIPVKIMVCIPLNLIPKYSSSKQQSQESSSRQLFKSTSACEDEIKTQKIDKECTIKNTIKSLQSKDQINTTPIKSDKSNSKNLKTKNNKDKPKNESSAKIKICSNVKNKVKDQKSNADHENKLLKRRKDDSEEKQCVKKPKLSQPAEDRKTREPSVLKIEPGNHSNDANKSKSLERCDSTGSLSSLGSQQSQRSFKSLKDRSKDIPTGAPETKRMKSSAITLLAVKDIKQEKNDKTKVHGIIDKSISSEKKNKFKDKLGLLDAVEQIWDDSLSSSQNCLFEDLCKDDSKSKILGSNKNLTEPENRELTDWDDCEMHKEMKETSTLNKLNPQAPVMPMDYYFTEGKKQKLLAEKEKDPFQQAVKYFEAAVLFILTSQQREEYSKDPLSVYQFYSETLKFSSLILSKVKKLQTCPGSTEFKLLILCLKCQSLLNVKLYNLKIKEIKEQLDGVADFLKNKCPTINPLKLRSNQSRCPSFFSISSPHSTIPSPASNSQNNNSDRSVSVPQSILDTFCRQHTHLINLHKGHDLWEQADMYMTRSNLREFFKEVAEQLEPLTLHSSITELVKYMQKGISLVKKSLR